MTSSVHHRLMNQSGSSVSAKIKLLYLVTEDWYFCSHRLGLARAAVNAGFQVSVVTRVSEHRATIEKAGIKVIPVAIARSSLNPFPDLLIILRLIALYRRERPDIVQHVALKPVLYGTIAARISGVRTIVNALAGMGWLFASNDIGKRRLPAAVLGWILRPVLRCSRVIVQNPEDAALVRQWTGSIPALIRGVGVNCELFTPIAPPSDVCLIVLPARMLKDKGVFEFVEAAVGVHALGLKARFALVGAPDQANRASIDIAQLQKWRQEGAVEWWGQQQDMAAVYAQAHIVCLPSYREGLPKALLEAAATGLPIVTTDVPGCREIVKDDYNGILVPARDVSALVKALTRLIAEPNTRKLMGIRGRLRACREFSEEQTISEMIKIYRTLAVSCA